MEQFNTARAGGAVRLRRWLVGGALACISVHSWAQFAPPLAATSVAVTDRLIVKYRNEQPLPVSVMGTDVGNSGGKMQPLANAKLSKLQRKLGESTFTVAQESATSFGARVVNLGRIASVSEVSQLAQNLVASDAEIEYAVPDRFIYLAQNLAPMAPSPSAAADQWSLYDPLSGIRALSAWQLFTALPQRRVTDPNFPLVAIIDSGYRPHVNLPMPFMGQDYVDGSSTPLDRGDSRTSGQCPNVPVPQASTWHGLAVEGIIAARISTDLGVSGVAGAGAGVLQQRVFGPCGGYLSNYLAAIRDAVDFRSPVGQRVRVINLSQAGPAPCDAPLQAEISRAVAAGVAVVVSAGNEAKDVSSSSPANCRGTIAVAATDRQGNRAPYSNFGSGVALAAPGGDSYSRTLNDGVLTTTLNLSGVEPTGQQASDYNYVQGTSFAAPHVSAAAALLFNLNPQFTPEQIKSMLMDSAKAVPGVCAGGCGAGLLDLRRALEMAQLQKNSAKLCRTFPACPR
jgi:serine protease